MKEKVLLKIAIICSMSGILLLFLVMDSIELSEKQISSIDNSNIEDEVLVSGRVAKIFESNSTMIIDVASYESIPVFLFKEEAILIKKGDYVEVRGTVDEYEDKVEIIGEEVRVVG